MAKSSVLSNAFLDATLNGNTTGSVTIGNLNLQLPFLIKFLSTLSTPDVSGTEWPSFGGYTTGGLSLAGLFDNPASSSTKSSSNAIILTNAPGGMWAGNEITDSSSQPIRLIFGPPTTLNKTINPGDTCIIPVGSMISHEQ